MAQEFTINSNAIEDKINQLLPSQGGFGAGVDFTASTMVIPIVDLTESAEGSNIRSDLQTAISHSISSFAVLNANTTIISNTGYFRVFGGMSVNNSDAGSALDISITDGSTSKIIIDGRLSRVASSVGSNPILPFDFVVFCRAGDSVVANSGSAQSALRGSTRQIADISGNLVNP